MSANFELSLFSVRISRQLCMKGEKSGGGGRCGKDFPM